MGKTRHFILFAAIIGLSSGACTSNALRKSLKDLVHTGPGGSGPTDHMPTGQFDSLSATNFIAAGWCFDQDSSATSLEYRGYLNGQMSGGVLAFSGVTNIERPDVNSAHNITGSHGFSHAIPANLITGSYQTLYVYCKNHQSNSWAILNGSPKSIGAIGGIVSQVRARNTSDRQRLSPVTSVISFQKGAVADQNALNALGLTVGGIPASAIVMENYYNSSNGQIHSVGLAKVVSQPIPFTPNEEKVLDVRADGIPLPVLEVTPRVGELLDPAGLATQFYVELVDTNGVTYTSYPNSAAWQTRALEFMPTNLTAEIRTRFKNASGANFQGLSATYTFVINSGTDTIRTVLRIANDIVSEPVNGGAQYKSLSVVFREQNGIRFDLNRSLYAIPTKVQRAGGWSSYCLDGNCLGLNQLTGSVSAPILNPISGGSLGDGQSLRLTAAITKYLDSEQAQLNAQTHLAESLGPIYGMQLYSHSVLSWTAASPIEFFHQRRFNEARATQIRAEDNSLCNQVPSTPATVATVLDFKFVPMNPGGTGHQPQFHTNGLPEEGWLTLWSESGCRLQRQLQFIEREFLRGQMYFEVQDGIDQPRTVTLSDRKPMDNYWGNMPFHGNGSAVVNTHNPSLSARSGSGWNAAIRRDAWECWSGSCGVVRTGNFSGWDDQHMTPGFILMAWKMTGDPMYKQLIEAFQTSIYLSYFNDWANGLLPGSWMRVSAHRAFGRMIETAVWFLRASDGTERAQVLREGVVRKIQMMAIPLSQSTRATYNLAGFAPENAFVGSVAFCGGTGGLHAIPGLSFPANCAWYASFGASGQIVGNPPHPCVTGVDCPTYYMTHWQYGFPMNAMSMLISMGIARTEALTMIQYYMDSAEKLHSPTGEPYSLVLYDDHLDHFSGGYHSWWMKPGALAATYLKTHSRWEMFQNSIIPWYLNNTAPGQMGGDVNVRDAFELPLDR